MPPTARSRRPDAPTAPSSSQPSPALQPPGTFPGGCRHEPERMPMTDDRRTAWDFYSQSKPQRRLSNAKGEATWFNWTQYADHGPGTEVLALNPSHTVLDLGCRSGGNLAHLTTLGISAIGVDVSGKQLDEAHERWPSIRGMELHQGDAAAYLALRSSTRCSASWVRRGSPTPAYCCPPFTPTSNREECSPSANDHPFNAAMRAKRHTSRGGPEDDPAIVKRWDYQSDIWCVLLRECGFPEVTATVLPAPKHEKRTADTLLVRRTGGLARILVGQLDTPSDVTADPLPRSRLSS